MVDDTRWFPCLICGATFTYAIEAPREAVQQMIANHVKTHA